MTRFAFAGLRHPHIFDMYQRCRDCNDIEIAACCEQDTATREELAASGAAEVTHDSFVRMLDQVDCEVIAIGDCYGHRGGMIEQALASARHVISDKPICITLQELERIETAARNHQRVVGCMLDMRDRPQFLCLRDLIGRGEIGQVRAVSFEGQHPLLYGRRPNWYFEPGMHGGTINDIAIHAVDLIPWATGQNCQQIVAARCWNAGVAQHPHFQECGQAMFTLENNAGVICDVSYLSPDSFGYEMPIYWRFTIWGDDGVIELSCNSHVVTLYKNGETDAREIPLPAPNDGGYLDAFLAEISGSELAPSQLSSADIFRATRFGLQLQQAADQR